MTPPTKGGVHNITLLLGQHARSVGGEMVGPVIPTCGMVQCKCDHGQLQVCVTYEGGQADDAADQPHQHDHAVHSPYRALKQIQLSSCK